jgi:hypothetical protein
MGQIIVIIFKYIIGGLIVDFGAVVAYLVGGEWGLREGVFVAAAYYSALSVLCVMFKETALAQFRRPILTTNFEMRQPFKTESVRPLLFLSRKYTQKTLNEIAGFYGKITDAGISQAARRLQKKEKKMIS